MTIVDPLTPTAFEIATQLIVPGVAGLGTLALATVSLIISIRAHRVAEAVAADQLERSITEERVELHKLIALWLKFRRKARKDDEKFGPLADVLYGRLVRALGRTEVQNASVLLLLISAINDDTERARVDPSRLAVYDFVLAYASEEWATDPEFLPDIAKLLAGLLLEETAADVPPSAEVVRVARLLESWVD